MHFRQLLLFLIFLILFPFSFASVFHTTAEVHCQIPENFFLEKVCLDENCSIWSENKQVLGGDNYHRIYFAKGEPYSTVNIMRTGYSPPYPPASDYAALFIEKACVEDASVPIQYLKTQTNFEKIITLNEWNANIGEYVKPLRYEDCLYYSPSFEGDWVVLNETWRNHCVMVISGVDLPSGPMPSAPNFVLALLFSPGSIDATNVIFLIIPILAIILFLLFRRYLKQKKQWELFIAPTSGKLGVLLFVGLVELFIHFFRIVDPLMIFVDLAVAYLILSLIGWVKNRNQPKRVEKSINLRNIIRTIIGLGIICFSLLMMWLTSMVLSNLLSYQHLISSILLLISGLLLVPFTANWILDKINNEVLRKRHMVITIAIFIIGFYLFWYRL